MSKYEKSFASHPRAKYWSDRNAILPEDVALNTHKKYWFNCDKCGHEFEKILRDINFNNGWCPYCVNKQLCDNDKCNSCFVKSFVSHPKSQFWSIKNDKMPRDVFMYSHKKYAFNCNECKHSFTSILSDISMNDSWCPYCANRKLCDDVSSCKLCYDKSFLSVDKSKYWSSKNLIKPGQIHKSSARKMHFECDKCRYEFYTRISHVTSGSWCPKCLYKTEDKIYNILREKYDTLAIQVKYEWCKDKKHLPFDFALEEHKILIECDGEQHWKQVAKWKTPEHNKKRDVYKMKCANENGYSIIRIVQEDVFHNKYDWFSELNENIQKIIDENVVQNIFMCKKDEYSYLKND